MSRVFARAREGPPPEKVLRQLRIPFVRRATMARAEAEEDVFIIDIGLSGAFIEREREMPVNEPVEIRFGWPGSEVPFRAQCRVAWWHPAGSHLVSKSLPPGAGLEFTEMSEADRGRLRALLVEYCSRHPQVRRFLRHWPETERQGDDPTAG